MLHVDAHLEVADARCFAAGISPWVTQLRALGELIDAEILETSSTRDRVVLRMAWSTAAAFDSFRADPVTRQAWANAGALAPPTFSGLVTTTTVERAYIS